MLPWWKIKRELARPFAQLLSLPVRLSSFLFGRSYYDAFLRNRARFYHGSREIGTKVCLFVIYPSSGYCDTQLLAMDSITDDSFSLVVLSNARLQSDVREKILSKCAILVERVNFGYDFGAYRDGVLFLKQAGHLNKIEHLWLLNDSCWYPMSDQSWPRLALEKCVDFVGATSAFGLPRNFGAVASRPGTDYRVTNRNFHYASYSLMISKNIIRDIRFFKFFNKLAISNNKRYTVRRGEIGLTQLVLKMKYSHCETHETRGIQNTLASLNNDQLLAMVENLTTLNRNFLRLGKEEALSHLKRMSSGTVPDRMFVEDFVIRCVARQGLCYTLPVWLIESNRFPFLKKSLRLMNPDNQRIMHSYARAHLPEASSIRREILQ